jgi:hypothetical protein
MTKNIGTADRTIRTISALVLGFLILNGTLTGRTAVIRGSFAVVFLLTGFVRFCPLYLPFKMSTRKQ